MKKLQKKKLQKKKALKKKFVKKAVAHVSLRGLDPDEPQSFEQYVAAATLAAHTALLREGGPGLSNALNHWFAYFSMWERRMKVTMAQRNRPLRRKI